MSERSVRNLENGAVHRPQRAAALRLAEAVGLDATVLPGTDGVRVGVLGPLVVEAGGAAADVGPAKQRALLGLLAVQPGVLLGVGELVDALWAERPPASAVNLVHTYCSRLRRALESCGPEVRVVSVRGGYLLQADAGALDVLRFDEHLAAAAEAGASPEAAGHFERALDCWRGPLLGDLPAGVRLQPAAAAVRRRRLNAALTYADAALDAGRCDAERLQPLVDEDPLHEGLHARLMLALAAAGEQAAALRAFDDIRRRLDDELGIAPGPELRAAHLRVLRHEVGRPAASEASTPAQLPAEVAGFVGRDEDLARLDAAADAARAMPIVSVVGAPGVGKTALAVRWAHRVADRYPDGQLYVNLRGYDERSPMQPIEALSRFLRALGVAPGQVPADEDEAAALYRTRLADRTVLVVLDNASSAQQVQPLLPGSETCAVVVTSRDSLTGLTAAYGARRVNLDVLQPDDAHRLLGDIVGENRAAAESTGIAALARTCGYLPLALRVVGADLDAQPHTPADAYADDLSGAAEIAGGDAVRAAFDLSYERLEPDAQSVFRLLGLIPGPDFSGDAISALAGCSASEARRLASRLVTASLLQPVASDRYRFHDLLRDYAAERAYQGSADDGSEALGRLYDFYLRSAHAASLAAFRYVLRKPLPDSILSADAAFADAGEALTWMDAERVNLVASVVQSDSLGFGDHGWRIVDAMRGYFAYVGYNTEGLEASEASLDSARRVGDTRAEASVLDVMGLVHYNMSSYDAALAAHDAALCISRSGGDRPAEASSLHNLGRVYSQLGRPAEAAAYYEQALAISSELGNVALAGRALNYRGAAALSLADLRGAASYAARALKISQDIEDRDLELRAMHLTGLVNWARGRLPESIDCHAGALEMAQESWNRHTALAATMCLAETYCDAMDDRMAEHFATEGLALARTLGERRYASGSLEVLAVLRHRAGDLSASEQLFDEAIAVAREADFGYGEISALVGLAHLYRDTERPGEALAAVERAVDLMRDAGIRLLESRASTEVAMAHLAVGSRHEAAEHAHRALTLARERGQSLAETRAREALGRINGLST